MGLGKDMLIMLGLKRGNSQRQNRCTKPHPIDANAVSKRRSAGARTRGCRAYRASADELDLIP